ncbi:hypothetical protein [Saccharicrinis sp. FJH62]|uniref:hypothetical protein n=1 Tax=Saccharicrinis sp. FJH62 TaxID=3344657 RepID=UPI0035D4540E
MEKTDVMIGIMKIKAKTMDLILSIIISVLLLSCESESPKIPEEEEPNDSVTMTYCNFEDKVLSFTENNNTSSLDYRIVFNPDKTGINASEKCGRVTTTSDRFELLLSEKLNREFNFLENGYAFKMKVYAPSTGYVYFKVQNGGGKVLSSEVKVYLNAANQWKELVFDFEKLAAPPGSGEMCKIVVLFDADSEKSGDMWYFDDITGPGNNLVTTVFKRYDYNPVLRRFKAGNPDWRNIHVANATILEPGNTPDGKWKMYVRGSGNVPEYHDQIGLLYQEADNFSPFGPWIEYENNPVLPYGEPGSYSERNVLDCAPVMGENDDMYLFYNAKAYTGVGSLGGSHSLDGGFSFQKFDQPVKRYVGCSDAIYHDGKYYLFFGDGNWDGSKFGTLRLYVGVTTDPTVLDESNIHLAIDVGGGPDNFDSFAVNGARVFRIKGIDKWFMTYQGSRRYFDFPNRFHIAYSDDLIHWTKVDNDKPLFERGDYGKWDQGGIWYGEIFEFEDKLYLYYEGWGQDGIVADRDVAYFSGGSQTGAAWVLTSDFIEWTGLDINK